MDVINFPRQMLPYKQKDADWRKRCVLWADSKSFFNYEPVRNTVCHKKINYDLVNGIIHMRDIQNILNPGSLYPEQVIPETIQHYPIINSKLNVLRGEEAKRPFDYRVVVTNPDAITQIEEHKQEAVMQSLQQLIQSNSTSQEEFQDKLDKLDDYYNFTWKDTLEVQANEYLNHYVKEYNIPHIFNDGFMDALTVGEEIYHCDIVGGEPIIERINPNKIHIFKSGYSNKIEDADIIVLEDWWSPGKIIDTYWDQLTEDDIKYIEDLNQKSNPGFLNGMGQYDDRYSLISPAFEKYDFTLRSEELFGNATLTSIFNNIPYDMAGNLRVLRIYWKSKRMIKKVKTYDPQTGEESFDYYSEDYYPDKNMDEESQSLWINEAWEGTLIGGVGSYWGDGKGIFVNMRPCPVQYNRISNPSKCSFGIVGTIYNLNDSRPFSMVDMMKPFNYLYDVVHYKLVDAISHNWGDILELDLAKVPAGWDVDKWMYFAMVNHIGVTDSFKEGSKGQATGKLAGSMNNNTKGVISSNIGNYIQQLISLLEYIKSEMGETSGISKQREGQVANRETVGGVERATLQSSLITEWLFGVHDDTKKRVLECFVDTIKMAAKEKNNIKFKYVASDLSDRIMTIDGNEFSMNDYGLVVDIQGSSNELNQKIDSLIQPALQAGKIDFSAIMKLWTTVSLSQKIRIIERNEQKNEQLQQQQQQQQAKAQEEANQVQLQQKQAELDNKETIAEMDNQTKIKVAEIQANVKDSNNNSDGIQPMSESERNKYREQVREFNKSNDLEKSKLELAQKKQEQDNALKVRQLNKSTNK